MITGILLALAGARRHQGQMRLGARRRRLGRLGSRGLGLWRARLGDEGRLGDGCVGRPRLVLFTHGSGNRGRIAASLDLVGRWNAQDRPALERVDVVAIERVGVGLEQGQHHRVEIGLVVRTRRAGDLRQRFTGRDRPILAGPGAACGGGRGLGRCGLGLRSRFRTRRLYVRGLCRSMFAFRRERLRFRARRFVRRTQRSCAGGGSGHRRIEQHRVFAQQFALGPVRDDEEIDQRLTHDILGRDMHHGLAAIGANREFQRHVDARFVQAYALEILRAGQRDFQPAGFGRRVGDDRNDRVQWLVEFGSDLDRSEAKCEHIAARKGQRDRQRQFCRSFHNVFPLRHLNAAGTMACLDPNLENSL